MGPLMKRPHGTCDHAGDDVADDDDDDVDDDGGDDAAADDDDDDATNSLPGGYTNDIWPRRGRHPPLAPLPP